MEDFTDNAVKDNERLWMSLYKDLAQPSIQTIGKSLGTTLEFFCTPFIALQNVNGRIKMNLQHRLHQYAKSLEQVPDDKRCEVHPELGVPIIQRLSYTTNDDIANLFVNLLTNASNLDNLNLSHPSFISIIDRLAPDEARLLKYINDNNGIILYVSFRAKAHKSEEKKDKTSFDFDYDMSFAELRKWLTLASRDVVLDFPDNLHMYWANLISCGLIMDGGDMELTNKDEIYNAIATYNQIENVRLEYVPSTYRDIETHHSFFQLTPLGEQFIQVCIGGRD